MSRRTFIKNTGIITSGIFLNKFSFLNYHYFPDVRIPLSERHFQSTSVEHAIKEFSDKVKDAELAWLFGNCLPNTLDTTVYYGTKNGRPDTYVITGDIDAMWLRDSSAQVWPYLSLAKQDKSLQQLIAGVINRQTYCILKDPYANAFYKDETKISEWKSDFTKMQPGVHERKWEIDSLCYPVRLAYQYWKTTGDVSPFDENWQKSIEQILKVFKEQQQKENQGSYSFQRNTSNATDTRSMGGFGYPVKPVGLICSAFRPSDDATIYSFLIPSNFFAVISLKHAAAMVGEIRKDTVLAKDLLSLAIEVEHALEKYATVSHPKYGKVFAYEVNGFGSFNLMDDANVPSLLSLPYLGAVKSTDGVYINTRKMILSEDNPFYFKGSAAEGIGGPHAGKDMIWPISIIMRGLTSNNDNEIRECIVMLKKSHAGKGFMHESFYKDDASKFTRPWFAWANTLFGEFLWKMYKEKPYLLKA